MPPIRSITILSDRIIITTARGVRTFLYSQIPQAAINQGAAAIEQFCTTWLNDPINGVAADNTGRHFWIEVRVVTLEPPMLTVRSWPVGGQIVPWGEG